ncbi:MAG: carbohydrate ABC transporter permease, partial [Clostridia bacterium]|nr:carbohydrate ABC transporter permease [Clostridia bacterium]
STLFPLQYLIMRMMRNIELMKQMAGQAGVVVDMASMPSTTTRMATAIVTIGPIIIAYPFAQKYFTSGLIVGSVKG